MQKASQLISADRKDELKHALNEDIRSMNDNDHTTSDYLENTYPRHLILASLDFFDIK